MTVTARPTVNDLLERSRSRIARLEPQEAWAAVSDGATLIDTRCAEQRRLTGVIPNSAHVPLSVLYWRLDPASRSMDPRLADPASHVIILCAHGYSSSIAAATLRDIGFARTSDVIGGFEGWRDAGLPVVPAED